jgi:hypothetical protein
MAFIEEKTEMNNCVNDFNPLIIAIATLMTAQVPAVIAMLMNQSKMKHDISVAKTLGYTIDRKTDLQTEIIKNGYKGPPGPPGPPGPSIEVPVNTVEK